MAIWSDVERCTVLRVLKTILAEEEYQKERVFRSILAELLAVESAIEQLAGAEDRISMGLADVDQRLDAAIRSLFLLLQWRRQKAIAEADDETLERVEAAERHVFPEGVDAIVRRPYAVELALVGSLETRVSEAHVASLIQEQGWGDVLRLIAERKEAMQKAFESDRPAQKVEARDLRDARKAFDGTISRLRRAIQATFSAAEVAEKALQDRLWKPLLEADRIAEDAKAQRLRKKAIPPTSSPSLPAPSPGSSPAPSPASSTGPAAPSSSTAPSSASPTGPALPSEPKPAT